MSLSKALLRSMRFGLPPVILLYMTVIQRNAAGICILLRSPHDLTLRENTLHGKIFLAANDHGKIVLLHAVLCINPRNSAGVLNCMCQNVMSVSVPIE